MDQPNFNSRLGTSPLINEPVKPLILYEGSLTEIGRTLDEVNRKVGSLLTRSTASHAPEFNNATALSLNLTGGP